MKTKTETSLRSTLTISEIFGPTIQGEGLLIGRPTIFVRSGGCDYRCVWCDTMYAVLPSYRGEWTSMESEEVLSKVLELSGGTPIIVSLSGGNPALQPFGPLIEMGHANGLKFALETQGSIWKPWFRELDYLTLSPKGPSSEMETDWQKLVKCIQDFGHAQVSLKVVVFNEPDYEYAKSVRSRFPGIPFFLQVGNTSTHPITFDLQGLIERFIWLSNRLFEDSWFDVTLLPQLHTIIWGNRKGI